MPLLPVHPRRLFLLLRSALAVGLAAAGVVAAGCGDSGPSGPSADRTAPAATVATVAPSTTPPAPAATGTPSAAAVAPATPSGVGASAAAAKVPDAAAACFARSRADTAKLVVCLATSGVHLGAEVPLRGCLQAAHDREAVVVCLSTAVH